MRILTKQLKVVLILLMVGINTFGEEDGTLLLTNFMKKGIASYQKAVDIKAELLYQVVNNQNDTSNSDYLLMQNKDKSIVLNKITDVYSNEDFVMAVIHHERKIIFMEKTGYSGVSDFNLEEMSEKVDEFLKISDVDSVKYNGNIFTSYSHFKDEIPIPYSGAGLEIQIDTLTGRVTSFTVNFKVIEEIKSLKTIFKSIETDSVVQQLKPALVYNVFDKEMNLLPQYLDYEIVDKRFHKKY